MQNYRPHQDVKFYFDLYYLEMLGENCEAGQSKEAATYSPGCGSIRMSHREVRRDEAVTHGKRPAAQAIRVPWSSPASTQNGKIPFLTFEMAF